ncbi:M1 family metallopeptidase [Caenimonas sp. SL110]|uniref:M1 family metallopeptidase n=1 Tax=Caenimonas sp. SL110 TaxID=1450524 RepID=UPI000AEA15B2|nr:M1 family metallopeptidase [Caenimonas sp. SL110]
MLVPLRLLFLSVIAAFISFAALGATPDPKPPQIRLTDVVQPIAYDLTLTIVPDARGFDGRVEIDVDLKRPLDFFWINARELAIGRVSLTIGAKVHEAAVVAGGPNFVGLRFASMLPSGRGRLSIAYTGTFTTKETRGIFTQQDRGQWYAYTQFEPMNARRAVPSFDEPRWKTPWTIALNVRQEHLAVSNNPAASETDIGNGMKQVRFTKTPPLPSYLVAFGVGPFEVVDGGTAGIKRTPLRYIVPKGRSAETRYAKEVTPKLLEQMETYFGTPYPYDKLDSMAIPVTVGFAAMENAGLITYGSGFLLANGAREDEQFRQVYASIGSHEIAHQWFGNLVTMQWWTDIWLNESFATWMARKAVSKFRPDWDSTARAQRERMSAAGTDRLASTRQVRQPVNNEDDLGNAFDGITYDKGGALLTMYEGWLGEEKFRDGVRRYLKKHEWGNATAQDFFASLAQADPQVARGFSGFVHQPGIPVVEFELDCSRSQPAMQLRQRRFDPLGASKVAQKWMMPVCMRYEGGGDKPLCTMLSQPRQRVVLRGAASCPAWVLPNPGGAGYYLSRLGAKSSGALPPAQLSAKEAVAFINDQALLARSGGIDAQALVAAVTPFNTDARPAVAQAAIAAVIDLHPAFFAAGKDRTLSQAVSPELVARAVELGWVPRPGESDEVRRLRATVLPVVAALGPDASLKAQARTLALAWLAGDRAQVGSGFRAVLQLMAHENDPVVFDALVAALPKTDDRGTRYDIYKTLGMYRDPVLRQRAFDLPLGDGVDVREASAIWREAAEVPDSAVALLQFVRDRYGVLASRLPEESASRMPRWHRELCTSEDRASVKRLYEAHKPWPPGLERILSQTLEAIDICVKARK